MTHSDDSQTPIMCKNSSDCGEMKSNKKKKKTWLEEQKSIQVKEKFMDYMKEYYLSNIL